MNALPAPDDLAIPLGSQHIHTERQVGTRRIILHVEGLDRAGIPMHDHRPVELIRQHRLFVASEVVAWLDRIAFLLQQRHRLIVADPRERGHDTVQFGGVALQDRELRPACFQHPSHDDAEQCFGQIHHLGQFGERDLGLHHPELHQVAPRL